MGVALRPLLAEYKESPGWEGLGGIAAVDAFNALYQFLSGIRQADGAPLMDGQGRITSHLSGLLFRNANLIEKNITPIYVFDGKPPVFKASTLAKRHEVRENAADAWEKALKEGDEESARKYAMASSKIDAFIIDSSKELLSALGIAWIQAPEEGEAQSSFMTRNGDVTYAVSQDYDSLLFGAPNLVRNITFSGKKRIRGKVLSVHPERLRLEEVLTGLSVTQEELIQIALLIGTDYNSGVPGVGPKTAVKIVREGKFYDRIGESENAAEPDQLIGYFLDPPVEKSYSIECRSPDPDRVIDLLCGEHGFTQERVEAGLEQLGAKKGQATLDAWF
ncbi:flap endonuclease-1 [uncultured Methanocorpusculum sp.]|nr:flap endonuclease-1 [uncultured Methanocorpusculum sp.]